MSRKTDGKRFRWASLFVSTALAAPLVAQSPKQPLKSVVADVETIHRQTLANGTVLRNVTQYRFIRDFAGRTRVEHNDRVVISDPARRQVLALLPAVGIAQRTVVPLAAGAAVSVTAEANEAPMELVRELGSKIIEGVKVEGREWRRTIPANSRLGNDLPIEQIFTVWYSKALTLAIQTMVQSPLSGLLTTTMRNIQVDVELDATLFDVPPGYKLVDVPAGPR